MAFSGYILSLQTCVLDSFVLCRKYGCISWDIRRVSALIHMAQGQTDRIRVGVSAWLGLLSLANLSLLTTKYQQLLLTITRKRYGHLEALHSQPRHIGRWIVVIFDLNLLWGQWWGRWSYTLKPINLAHFNVSRTQCLTPWWFTGAP